ncbi:integrase core domain-containing protein [Chryseobacterium sp. Bi04]|uniref:integrase core domain-containing protein n=1 Tax=Chryseobacterium sp. Bi04 TaxID=2822345 RepID=UPI0033B86977
MKTKAKDPQNNGMYESFNGTIKEECYVIAFRKKIYRSIERLQLYPNKWLSYCNK